VLDGINLSNSINYISSFKEIIVGKIVAAWKLRDNNRCQVSSSVPHYLQILSHKRNYLHFNLPYFIVKLIFNFRLNFSKIYFNGNFVDLGMWKRAICKFCGDNLSLFHVIYECNNFVDLRRNLRVFPSLDSHSSLVFLSNLANIKYEYDVSYFYLLRRFLKNL